MQNKEEIRMRLLTWNVNGFRAVKKKGLEQILEFLDVDIFCLQEIKAMPDQIELDEDLFPYQYINSAERKGYSGTMIASRIEPLSVTFGLGDENVADIDKEGRVVTAEFEDFMVVTVYTPNAKDGLARIADRERWDKAFAKYVNHLPKPALLCGDMNIARGPLDIWDEADGIGSAGYSDIERNDFESLLMPHYEDVYRVLHPQGQDYSWWSYYSRGRERNQGWRIDYWLASPSLMPEIQSIEILGDVYGSDHCPVLLELNDH